MREINDILNEEITPTLTKLKEERTTYLEYQKIQRELEHLTKLYVAYKFIVAEETAAKLNQVSPLKRNTGLPLDFESNCCSSVPKCDLCAFSGLG